MGIAIAWLVLGFIGVVMLNIEWWKARHEVPSPRDIFWSFLCCFFGPIAFILGIVIALEDFWDAIGKWWVAPIYTRKKL